MKFLVAQLGARMHYAVPRLLEKNGMLDRFYTDLYGARGWPRLLNCVPGEWRTSGLKRILGRIPAEVPAQKVRAFNSLGVSYALKRRRASTKSEANRLYVWAARKFCGQILKAGLGEATSVYTFNSEGLELLEHARQSGLRTFVEQTIAPKRLGRTILVEEFERFPDWEPLPYPGDAATIEIEEREMAEWQQADVILCGSEFVKEGIASCRGPADRCKVVPYGVEAPASRIASEREPRRGGPLRVLTVGEVGLRKGSPYVVEAARRFGGPAEFRLVGQINLLRAQRQRVAQWVQLTGAVPRCDIVEHYRWADVFLLPSLWEGSATVTYEAMAHGLPVIATPNTGTVVRDGIDGFIVPVRDTDAIVALLQTLASHPEQLRALSGQALRRAEEFNLSGYATRLVQALK